MTKSKQKRIPKTTQVRTTRPGEQLFVERIKYYRENELIKE